LHVDHRQRMKNAALALAAALPALASAVYLNPVGTGQALIYPYYTVQSANGDAFNTYLSVVNTSGFARALRVRLREARAGKPVASVNVYLSSLDTWTAAIVPGATASDPPRLVTADATCTDPPVPPGGLALDGTSLNDGNGTDSARMREGFAEVLEMGAFTSVAQSGCSTFTPPAMQAPVGGLTGTVTLINVAKGVDFAVNAAALAQLASKPYFRPASDPYPDFNAAEIDPWSVDVVAGALHRTAWSRPVDAVSAALMSSSLGGEFILDSATRSSSEAVITMPTRHFYANAGTMDATPPFTAISPWTADCKPTNEIADVVYWDREGKPPDVGIISLAPAPGFPLGICSDVFVWSLRGQGQAATPDGSSGVLGSRVRDSRIDPALQAGRVNGSYRLFATGALSFVPGLRGTSASTRMTLSDGGVTNSAQALQGLPWIGFWVRTFENGTFTCDAGTCQGNYGAAFPLTRSGPTVVPPQ
jgi:hypothetical protein